MQITDVRDRTMEGWGFYLLRSYLLRPAVATQMLTGCTNMPVRCYKSAKECMIPSPLYSDMSQYLDYYAGRAYEGTPAVHCIVLHAGRFLIQLTVYPNSFGLQ